MPRRSAVETLIVIFIAASVSALRRHGVPPINPLIAPGTSPAAATAAAAAAPEPTAAAARLLWPCLVDRQRTAVALLVVQAGNRRLRFLVSAHFDEPESL